MTISVSAIWLLATALQIVRVSYKVSKVRTISREKVSYFGEVLVEKLLDHNVVAPANFIRCFKIAETWDKWVRQFDLYIFSMKIFGVVILADALFACIIHVPTLLTCVICLICLYLATMTLGVVKVQTKQIDLVGYTINTVVEGLDRQRSGQLLDSFQRTFLEKLIMTISSEHYWKDLMKRS